MKLARAIALSTLIPISGAFAQSLDLVPLLDAIERQADRSYVYARCAALYGAGMDFATRIEGPQTDENAETFLAEIGFHLSLAHIEAGHDALDLPVVNPEVSRLVNLLQNRYDALIIENYLSSGNSITGIIADDLDLCAALKEATVE